MKNIYIKLVMAFILLIFLSSCNSNDAEYISKEYHKAYAYNVENEKIDEVNIDYELNNYVDVFNLYTKYQNHLPLGYISCASSNITLNKSYVKDKTVYYEVDSYVSLSKDISIFLDLLRQENNDLGYANTYLIYNDVVLS